MRGVGAAPRVLGAPVGARGEAALGGRDLAAAAVAAAAGALVIWGAGGGKGQWLRRRGAAKAPPAHGEGEPRRRSLTPDGWESAVVVTPSPAGGGLGAEREGAALRSPPAIEVPPEGQRREEEPRQTSGSLWSGFEVLFPPPPGREVPGENSPWAWPKGGSPARADASAPSAEKPLDQWLRLSPYLLSPCETPQGSCEAGPASSPGARSGAFRSPEALTPEEAKAGVSGNRADEVPGLARPMPGVHSRAVRSLWVDSEGATNEVPAVAIGGGDRASAPGASATGGRQEGRPLGDLLQDFDPTLSPVRGRTPDPKGGPAESSKASPPPTPRSCVTEANLTLLAGTSRKSRVTPVRKWLKLQEAEPDLVIPGSELYLGNSVGTPPGSRSAGSIPSAREATLVASGGGSPLSALEFPKTPPLYGLTMQGSPDERHGFEATPCACTEPEDLAKGIRSKLILAKVLAGSVRATGSALALRVRSKADIACQRYLGIGARVSALIWVVCVGPLLFHLFHVASTTIPPELSEGGRAWSWAMGPARLERLLSRTLGLDTLMIAS